MKDQVPLALIDEVLECMRAQPEYWNLGRIGIWDDDLEGSQLCMAARYFLNGRNVVISKPCHIFSKPTLNDLYISNKTYKLLINTLKDAKREFEMLKNNESMQDIYTRLREINGRN